MSSHAYAQLSPVFNAMQAKIDKLTNGTNGDLYSVTGCGTDFLQWKWAEMNRAVGEVAA